MNLSGLLFLQYRDGKSNTFASWWMNWHGRLFLGKPEDKGMDWIRQDLRDSYYWAQADRLLPTETKALQEWQEQSMFVAWFRHFESAAAAKVVTAVCMVLVLGLVFLGGVFDGTARAGTAMSTGIGSLLSSEAGSDNSDLAWCKDIQTKAVTGTLSPAEQVVAMNDPRFGKCDALLSADQ